MKHGTWNMEHGTLKLGTFHRFWNYFFLILQDVYLSGTERIFHNPASGHHYFQFVRMDMEENTFGKSDLTFAHRRIVVYFRDILWYWLLPYYPMALGSFTTLRKNISSGFLCEISG